jgi:hypothetical protein
LFIRAWQTGQLCRASGLTSSSSWRFNISRARLRDTVSSSSSSRSLSSLWLKAANILEKRLAAAVCPSVEIRPDMEQVGRGQSASLDNKVFFKAVQGKVTIEQYAGSAGQFMDGTRSFLEQ